MISYSRRWKSLQTGLTAQKMKRSRLRRATATEDRVENPETDDSTLGVPVEDATVPFSFRARLCKMLLSIL